MNVNCDDLVLQRIIEGWECADGEKANKSRAKWLRLLVMHVKSPEGIPPKDAPRIKEWTDYLLAKLGDMDTETALQCVSAIDYARAKLGTRSESFGEGLKRELTAIERKRVTDRHRPLNLRPRSVEP